MATVIDYLPVTKEFGATKDEALNKLYAEVVTESMAGGQRIQFTTRIEVPETITAGALALAVETAVANTWVANGYEYPS